MFFYQFFCKYPIVVPSMSEQEQENKERKIRRHRVLLETERVESELFRELMKSLEELEKEKKYADIQMCPKCKSPLVRRVDSMTGDMSGHMGWTPPKYECRECGWRERLVLKATNRPTSIRDAAIMAEAKDAENETEHKK
jgi:RNase P subunit RPR2